VLEGVVEMPRMVDDLLYLAGAERRDESRPRRWSLLDVSW
jgi:hypothetical protein